jgi:hypothetical protein
VKGFSVTNRTSLRRKPYGDLPPRTISYVEAMISEGDNFDYSRWLRRIREEEDRARPDERPAMERVVRPLSAECEPRVIPLKVHGSIGREEPKRPLAGPCDYQRSLNGGSEIWRRISKVRRAWAIMNESRGRDAVYGYLDAVFALVMHYQSRRRTKRLLRLAFKRAGVTKRTQIDPFTAIIRCTCGGDVDCKTVSRWSRALRYVAHRKEPGMSVKKFMKAIGGINASANRYAQIIGRGRRRDSF